eukprot:364707-Chlamydomonas_euryale.AAC.7
MHHQDQQQRQEPGSRLLQVRRPTCPCLLCASMDRPGFAWCWRAYGDADAAELTHALLLVTLWAAQAALTAPSNGEGSLPRSTSTSVGSLPRSTSTSVAFTS